MKGISELIKQKTFNRDDLKDIYNFCKIQGNFSPLLAVIFIARDQRISNEDLVSFGNLLDKYPELANAHEIRTQIYQED